MTCPSCSAPLAADARFCQRCGAAAPEAVTPTADPIRETLKVALGRQYEVLGLLGRGGMGAVYLATEAALEREVAIKVLPPDRGATKDSRDRFRREARTAAKLSHPNIVPLYTFGDVDGTLYFVMGYVKGESLAARLKREGRLSLEESRRILIEIAEALDYAHKVGVIHRDIKPDNVLLEEGTGRALLTDFGVAKALGAGQTMTEVGSVLGTPQYMSPEQAQGKADIDHRTDIYSLGVMGYAMLAGRLPFEGPAAGDIMAQHITKEAPPLKSFAPDVPIEIASALTRCLGKAREDRWLDARSLKEAISERDEGTIPEDMIEVRRDTAMVALGLYLSMLVGLHLVQRSVDPDPASFTPPWEIVFFATGAGALLWIGMVVQRRRDGRPWREILWFAFAKPAWWVGLYPSRLRHARDVWQRLPPDLRRVRAVLWLFVLAWLAFMPPQMIIFASDDIYRKTGQKAPLQRLAANLPKAAARVMALSFALAFLGLMTSLIAFAFRWGRVVSRMKTKRRWTNAMLFQDTAHPSFWLKPEVAAFLLPDAPKLVTAPASPRDLVSGIATAMSRLDGRSQALGANACAAASELADSITALDHEIASLGGADDPQESDRLIGKISALGAPSPAEGDAKAQMRGLLQKQLDLHREVETRLVSLKDVRSRKHALLRSLWQEAQAVRTAASDPGRQLQSSERLRSLCTKIESGRGGPDTLAATGTISDAPTIERS